MFGHIFNPKIKQKNKFWGISGSSLHFFIDALNSFSKNASLTHFNSWRQDPETTKFFKTKAKCVENRMKWIVMPYSES